MARPNKYLQKNLLSFLRLSLSGQDQIREKGRLFKKVKTLAKTLNY